MHIFFKYPNLIYFKKAFGQVLNKKLYQNPIYTLSFKKSKNSSLFKSIIYRFLRLILYI